MAVTRDGASVSPSAEREIHVLLPGDVVAPTGGNVYDLRVIDGLATAHGWRVRRTDVAGSWPLADHSACAGLTQVLAAVPDGGLVLVDGIVACGVPEVIEPAAGRLRIVVLVHLPLPDETGLSTESADSLARLEGRTLRAAAAVVVTSPWAARRLGGYDLAPAQVHVAPPGTDSQPVARGTLGSGRPPELLCVGAVTPRKDQLTLVDALAQLPHLAWRCSCIGPVDRAAGYVTSVRERVVTAGLEGLVRLVGALDAEELAASYDAADLVVLVSRTETFGMVITEALARGVPVVTTAGGAAEETLGRAPDGTVPGLVVPPGDAGALAAALSRWLTDAPLRARLASSARARRDTLDRWDETARALAAVLAGLESQPSGS